MCEIGYRVEGGAWVGGNRDLGLERTVTGGRFGVKTLLWFR